MKKYLSRNEVATGRVSSDKGNHSRYSTSPSGLQLQYKRNQGFSFNSFNDLICFALNFKIKAGQ